MDHSAFDQQFNVGIGTAFAFLVRALLVLSVGTTYWQLFWRTLRSRTLSVARIDTIFSLLDNPFTFAKVGTLRRHALLVLVALLSWTIPIAIIVPPSTLSIHSQPFMEHPMRAMPTPFFDTSTMATVSDSVGFLPGRHNVNTGTTKKGCAYNGDYILYNGPGQRLSRLASATAFQGALPSFPSSDLVNASYTLTFHGPTVRCENASQNIMDLLGADSYGGAEGRPDYYYNYEYISWTPTNSSIVRQNVKGFAGDIVMDQIWYNQTTSGVKTITDDGFSSFLGQYHGQAPSLFMAYRTEHNYGTYPILSWEALQCTFQNATYTVDFRFPNGEQKINITSVRTLPNQLETSVPIWRRCKDGVVESPLTGEQVGYQAMIEALGQVLVGTVSWGEGLYQTRTPITDQTSILKTDLAFSNELVRLYAAGGAPSKHWTAPKQYEKPEEQETNEALQSVPRTHMTLAASVEQLFHNMTVSLFSDQSMLKVRQLADKRTEVQIAQWQNVYSYSWQRLVIAYGAAVLATSVAVLIGFATLITTGVAYSYDFSTFMRALRGQHIDDIVAAYDHTDGAEPLPKALAKARISLISSNSSTPKGSPAMTEGTEGDAEEAERTEMIHAPRAPQGLFAPEPDSSPQL